MSIIEAKNLRDNGILLSVPDNLPGWYRWWAKENDVKTLLDSKYLNKKYFNNLIAYLPKGIGDLKNYYCIYTGIAVKESIRARLRWHISQAHSQTTVKSGFLSTFRQSISSLVSGDQMNENDTNLFVDKLTVEYYSESNPIKSEEAKKTLEKNEYNEMSQNVLVLNIQENRRKEIQEFLKDLKQARYKAKQKALKEEL
jgi:hypothetical protein